MKGRRAFVVLDVVATYGQRLGCDEIHLEPINEALRELYIGVYGFAADDGAASGLLKRKL